jgi:hypothetical protein
VNHTACFRARIPTSSSLSNFLEYLRLKPSFGSKITSITQIYFYAQLAEEAIVPNEEIKKNFQSVLELCPSVKTLWFSHWKVYWKQYLEVLNSSETALIHLEQIDVGYFKQQVKEAPQLYVL